MDNDNQLLEMGELRAPARVVVAMSGGVDSSVVAALLHEAGYDVVGLTMQLYNHGEMAAKKKACCAGIDIYDARHVADHIGFPHYVVDYENRFKQDVMEQFAESYLAGETPIPCVRCNQTVKFRDLFGTAKALGAEALITGHYVRRLMGKCGPELHCATDTSRDQSYFLFGTTLEQLAFLRFPLGHLSKTVTRAQARRLSLPVHNKPDSQDICFVPNGNYAAVVQRLRPGALEPGDIVDCEGRVLGRHHGIIHYTVGQRKGLGIPSSNGQPLYVLRLDPQHHRVVVGPKEALARRKIYVREMNWLLYPAEQKEQYDVAVKIRSSQEPLPATVQLDEGEKAIVTLAQPEYGVANGQACVFYQATRVLGGGWICGSE
jgi:tRNA-specific 2-thiouridylase